MAVNHEEWEMGKWRWRPSAPAFTDFADAVRFCGALHLALLNIPWSVALLAKPGCSEERDPVTVGWCEPKLV